MPKKKTEIPIRSSAAEYLTLIATTGDDRNSVEIRCEGCKLSHIEDI